MRGLWTKETRNLALEMAKGNPGCLRVINELLWFSKWNDMMKWCIKNKFTGSKVWKKYKDEFHCDSNKLGRWIQQKMLEEQDDYHKMSITSVG